MSLVDTLIEALQALKEKSRKERGSVNDLHDAHGLELELAHEKRRSTK